MKICEGMAQVLSLYFICVSLSHVYSAMVQYSYPLQVREPNALDEQHCKLPYMTYSHHPISKCKFC